MPTPIAIPGSTDIFPRGQGKSTPAAPSDSKKRKQQQDENVLFGAKKESKVDQIEQPQAKKKKTTTTKLTNKSITQTAPAFAHHLSFKNLKKGTILLGCISQINEHDVLLSLPNSLTGVVAKNQVSDLFATEIAKKNTEALPKLDSFLKVGQFVPCSVLECVKGEKGKRIKLSMRCSLFNKYLSASDFVKGKALFAVVESLEDHGAIVNLGVKGLTGFIPTVEMEKNELNCTVGQIHFCSISSINQHTRTATLSLDWKTSVKTVTKGEDFKLNSLIPGMLLNVKVEEVLKNGLYVNFLSYFNGTVEFNHLSTPCQPEWNKSFTPGMKGRARIIAIDMSSKSISLSMAPHVVHLQVPVFEEKIGDIVKNATIQRIDSSIGMLLSLKNRNDNDDSDRVLWKDFHGGYVHISRISDDRTENLDKKFKLNQKHDCRVVSYSLFDGICNVSMKQSSLNQSVLRLDDLVPGQLVSGTVVAIESWGTLIQIGEGIRGLVQSLHFPFRNFLEIMTSKGKKRNSPQVKKYSIGSTVEARVLYTDKAEKKVSLSLKPSLISSTLPPLTSFDDAAEFKIAEGFITKIAEYGLIVSFYNRVHGLVPAAVLKKAGVEDLNKSYTVGQVAKACIVRCDPKLKRMRLTLDVSFSKKTSRKTNMSINIGEVVSGKVIECESDFLRIETDSGLEGILPHDHLSDYSSFIESIISSISIGDKLSNLIVLSNRSDGMAVLSMKSSLMNPKSNVPSNISDVSKGMELTGFVKSVHSFGVFIQFLGNLIALAPKSRLTDQFIEDTTGLFKQNDTVRCVVENIDNVKEQIYVSMMSSLVAHDCSYLKGLIQKKMDVFVPDNNSLHYKIGKTEKAEVIGKRDYGVVLKLSEDLTALIPSSIVSYSPFNVDEKMKDTTEFKRIRLIDYDFEKKIFYASHEKELVSVGKKRNSLPKLKQGETFDGVVLFLHREYCVVSVKGNVGLLQVTDFHCPSNTCDTTDFAVGSTVSVCVDSYNSNAKGLFADLYYFFLSNTSRKRTTKVKSEKGESLPKYTSSDLELGKFITGHIIGIKENTIDVKVKVCKKAGKVTAYVSIVDIDALEDSKDHLHAFDAFAIGQRITGRIVSSYSKGANQRKPISDTNPAAFRSLYISLKKDDLDQSKSITPRADWSGDGLKLLEVGNKLMGVVSEIANDSLLVKVSGKVHGFCHALETSNEFDEVKIFAKQFPIGKHVDVTVAEVDIKNQKVSFTMRDVAFFGDKNFVPGTVMNCMIKRKIKPVGPPSLMVQLGAHLYGRVCISELTDKESWDNLPLDIKSSFKDDAFMQCIVLDSSAKGVDVSLREPRVSTKDITMESLPAVGDLVKAYVSSTTSSGCFLRLSRNIDGRVLLRDLSDKFIEDPKKLFPSGMLVVGRVLKVNEEKGSVEMSLKKSVVADDASVLQLSDLKVGMNVKGVISSIKTYGVFVKIEKSNLSGLCHISEVHDEKVNDVSSIFNVDDYVKAKILKIEDRRISLGLKPSYFEDEPSSEDEDDEDSSDDEAVDENTNKKNSMSSGNTSQPTNSKTSHQSDVVMEESDGESAGDSDNDVDSSEEMDVDQHMKCEMPTNGDSGFAWDGFSLSNNVKSESESDDEVEVKTKSEKKMNKKHLEEEIRERELALANGGTAPETVDDFERLLTASPNSSFLWIKYMAYHMSMTEIDLARGVAERAVKAIFYKEEQERMNVWVAYLNLEHTYGDEKSFKKVFDMASKVNNPKIIYLKLVEIYENSNKWSEAETALKTMHKKFNTSKKVWLKSIDYYLRTKKNSEKASELLKRSLKSLPAHKHLKVTSKYAQDEYQFGSAERGRTIFEGLLSNYPKKVDLWSVYLDKEIKFGTHELARRLFERLVHMKFSAKKMKFLFKKYIKFETDFGTDKTVEHVKQLAQAYVEAAASH